MLASGFGPNHANVHVQSELNFDQQKTTSITNTAPAGTDGKPLPQQQNTSDEKFNGGGAAGTNGVLGVTQGVPAAATGGKLRRTTRRRPTRTQRGSTSVWKEPAGAGQDQPALGRGAARQLGGEAADVANWTKQIQAAGRLQQARGHRAGVVGRVQQRRGQGCQGPAESRHRVEPEHDDGPRPPRRDVVDHRAGAVLRLARSSGPRRTACRSACRSTCASSKPPTLPCAGDEWRNPTARRAERQALAPAADTGVEGELTDLIEHQPDEVAQTLRSWLADRRT